MAPTTRRQALTSRSQQANQEQPVYTVVTAAPPVASSTARRTTVIIRRTQPRNNQQRNNQPRTEAPTDNNNSQPQSGDRRSSVDIDLTRSRSATPMPRLTQNITIDLTDSSPEPEQSTNPLIHDGGRTSAARVSSAGRGRSRGSGRIGADDPNSIARTPWTTGAPSASKRSRISTGAESQAEEDDEEFPVIKELQEARQKRISEAANESSVQGGISCPICFDDSATITKEGRQMMSTTCGHVFCSSCVKGLFVGGVKSAECPKCRKKLQPKLIHPIFL